MQCGPVKKAAAPHHRATRTLGMGLREVKGGDVAGTEGPGSSLHQQDELQISDNMPELLWHPT